MIRTLANVEKETILEAIIAAGSVRGAANALGTTRMTLYRKLRSYGLLIKANQIIAELRKQKTLEM